MQVDLDPPIVANQEYKMYSYSCTDFGDAAVKWYSTLVRKIWRLRKGSVSTVHTYGTRYSTLVLTIWFVSACEYAGNGSRYKV